MVSELSTQDEDLTGQLAVGYNTKSRGNMGQIHPLEFDVEDGLERYILSPEQSLVEIITNSREKSKLLEWTTTLKTLKKVWRPKVVQVDTSENVLTNFDPVFYPTDKKQAERGGDLEEYGRSLISKSSWVSRSWNHGFSNGPKSHYGQEDIVLYCAILPFIAFFGDFGFVLYPMRNYFHPTALADKHLSFGRARIEKTCCQQTQNTDKHIELQGCWKSELYALFLKLAWDGCSYCYPAETAVAARMARYSYCCPAETSTIK
uniref:ADP,ATP carrier protein n=1 Tax=Chenopodium quinoa TaxID=63459 RepID=A0A803N603_CHEQI